MGGIRFDKLMLRKMKNIPHNPGIPGISPYKEITPGLGYEKREHRLEVDPLNTMGLGFIPHKPAITIKMPWAKRK